MDRREPADEELVERNVSMEPTERVGVCRPPFLLLSLVMISFMRRNRSSFVRTSYCLVSFRATTSTRRTTYFEELLKIAVHVTAALVNLVVVVWMAGNRIDDELVGHQELPIGGRSRGTVAQGDSRLVEVVFSGLEKLANLYTVSVCPWVWERSSQRNTTNLPGSVASR